MISPMEVLLDIAMSSKRLVGRERSGVLSVNESNGSREVCFEYLSMYETLSTTLAPTLLHNAAAKTSYDTYIPIFIFSVRDTIELSSLIQRRYACSWKKMRAYVWLNAF
jgi:hypothetical protein